MKKSKIHPRFISLSPLLTLMLCACVTTTTVPPKQITTHDWAQATKQVTQQYASSADQKLAPHFQKAAISYPPKKIALLTFKQEQKIELWAKDSNSSWQYIKNYPLTAFSGKLGPKLKANDMQIPEGIYHISWLNPFSQQHLSMKLDYPNSFDRTYAKVDGRKQLGGDIFIHGKDTSAGCLAIGDPAINELFVLVSRVGTGNTQVIISPTDLRKSNSPEIRPDHPRWVPQLYQTLSLELQPFKHNMTVPKERPSARQLLAEWIPFFSTSKDVPKKDA